MRGVQVTTIALLGLGLMGRPMARTIHGARMAERAYAPGGKVSTQLKDLRLAQALADAAGLRLPHLDDTAARYARLAAAGAGELDHSALHRLLLDEQADAPVVE